ncbi:DUF3558 family protein [Rhodococcoides yunnanense]|uniref:DUF3558 family protein n=1 Tax=Rhodococcoides yunnanense TaxID=278209 RepID=UPI001FEBCE21|nr:DUF3558 family protein [Rhodococcus yunnanensis]
MRKWVPACVAVVALLSGCGDGVEPHAVGEPTRWDPCSITPEAIGATGLDPGYRDEGWGDGIVVPDWAICSFKSPGVDISYFLVVKSSSTHTIEEARQDPLNVSGRGFVLDGRDAFQFETEIARSIDDCNVAVGLPHGVAVFTVNYMDVGDGVDPCGLLLGHLADLKSALP